MKTRIGKWNLVDDVECKCIAGGFEIFPVAVEKYGIKPTDITSTYYGPATAEWGVNGSIIVEQGK